MSERVRHCAAVITPMAKQRRVKTIVSQWLCTRVRSLRRAAALASWSGVTYGETASVSRDDDLFFSDNSELKAI